MTLQKMNKERAAISHSHNNPNFMISKIKTQLEQYEINIKKRIKDQKNRERQLSQERNYLHKNERPADSLKRNTHHFTLQRDSKPSDKKQKSGQKQSNLLTGCVSYFIESANILCQIIEQSGLRDSQFALQIYKKDRQNLQQVLKTFSQKDRLFEPQKVNSYLLQNTTLRKQNSQLKKQLFVIQAELESLRATSIQVRRSSSREKEKCRPQADRKSQNKRTLQRAQTQLKKLKNLLRGMGNQKVLQYINMVQQQAFLSEDLLYQQDRSAKKNKENKLTTCIDTQLKLFAQLRTQKKSRSGEEKGQKRVSRTMMQVAGVLGLQFKSQQQNEFMQSVYKQVVKLRQRVQNDQQRLRFKKNEKSYIDKDELIKKLQRTINEMENQRLSLQNQLQIQKIGAREKATFQEVLQENEQLKQDLQHIYLALKQNCINTGLTKVPQNQLQFQDILQIIFKQLQSSTVLKGKQHDLAVQNSKLRSQLLQKNTQIIRSGQQIGSLKNNLAFSQLQSKDLTDKKQELLKDVKRLSAQLNQASQLLNIERNSAKEKMQRRQNEWRETQQRCRRTVRQKERLLNEIKVCQQQKKELVDQVKILKQNLVTEHSSKTKFFQEKTHLLQAKERLALKAEEQQIEAKLLSEQIKHTQARNQTLQQKIINLGDSLRRTQQFIADRESQFKQAIQQLRVQYSSNLKKIDEQRESLQQSVQKLRKANQNLKNQISSSKLQIQRQLSQNQLLLQKNHLFQAQNHKHSTSRSKIQINQIVFAEVVQPLGSLASDQLRLEGEVTQLTSKLANQRMQVQRLQSLAFQLRMQKNQMAGLIEQLKEREQINRKSLIQKDQQYQNKLRQAEEGINNQRAKLQENNELLTQNLNTALKMRLQSQQQALALTLTIQQLNRKLQESKILSERVLRQKDSLHQRLTDKTHQCQRLVQRRAFSLDKHQTLTCSVQVVRKLFFIQTDKLDIQAQGLVSTGVDCRVVVTRQVGQGDHYQSIASGTQSQSVSRAQASTDMQLKQEQKEVQRTVQAQQKSCQWTDMQHNIKQLQTAYQIQQTPQVRITIKHTFQAESTQSQEMLSVQVDDQALQVHSKTQHLETQTLACLSLVQQELLQTNLDYDSHLLEQDTQLVELASNLSTELLLSLNKQVHLLEQSLRFKQKQQLKQHQLTQQLAQFIFGLGDSSSNLQDLLINQEQCLLSIKQALHTSQEVNSAMSPHSQEELQEDSVWSLKIQRVQLMKQIQQLRVQLDSSKSLSRQQQNNLRTLAAKLQSKSEQLEEQIKLQSMKCQNYKGLLRGILKKAAVEEIDDSLEFQDMLVVAIQKLDQIPQSSFRNSQIMSASQARPHKYQVAESLKAREIELKRSIFQRQMLRASQNRVYRELHLQFLRQIQFLNRRMLDSRYFNVGVKNNNFWEEYEDRPKQIIRLDNSTQNLLDSNSADFMSAGNRRHTNSSALDQALVSDSVDQKINLQFIQVSDLLKSNKSKQQYEDKQEQVCQFKEQQSVSEVRQESAEPINSQRTYESQLFEGSSREHQASLDQSKPPQSAKQDQQELDLSKNMSPQKIASRSFTLEKADNLQGQQLKQSSNLMQSLRPLDLKSEQNQFALKHHFEQEIRASQLNTVQSSAIIPKDSESYAEQRTDQSKQPISNPTQKSSPAQQSLQNMDKHPSIQQATPVGQLNLSALQQAANKQALNLSALQLVANNQQLNMSAFQQVGNNEQLNLSGLQQVANKQQLKMSGSNEQVNLSALQLLAKKQQQNVSGQQQRAVKQQFMNALQQSQKNQQVKVSGHADNQHNYIQETSHQQSNNLQGLEQQSPINQLNLQYKQSDLNALSSLQVDSTLKTTDPLFPSGHQSEPVVTSQAERDSLLEPSNLQDQSKDSHKIQQIQKHRQEGSHPAQAKESPREKKQENSIQQNNYRSPSPAETTSQLLSVLAEQNSAQHALEHLGQLHFQLHDTKGINKQQNSQQEIILNLQAVQKYNKPEQLNMPTLQESDNQVHPHLSNLQKPKNQNKLNLPAFQDPKKQDRLDLSAFQQAKKQDQLNLSAFQDPKNQNQLNLSAFQEPKKQDQLNLSAFQEPKQQDQLNLSAFQDPKNQNQLYLSAFQEPKKQDKLNLLAFQQPKKQDQLNLSVFQVPINQNQLNLSAFQEPKNQNQLNLSAFDDPKNQNQLNLSAFQDPKNQNQLNLSAFEEPKKQQQLNLSAFQDPKNQNQLNLSAFQKPKQQQQLNLSAFQDTKKQDQLNLSAFQEPKKQQQLNLSAFQEPKKQDQLNLSAFQDPKKQDKLNLLAFQDPKNQNQLNLSAFQDPKNQNQADQNPKKQDELNLSAFDEPNKDLIIRNNTLGENQTDFQPSENFLDQLLGQSQTSKAAQLNLSAFLDLANQPLSQVQPKSHELNFSALIDAANQQPQLNMSAFGQNQDQLNNSIISNDPQLRSNVHLPELLNPQVDLLGLQSLQGQPQINRSFDSTQNQQQGANQKQTQLDLLDWL